MGTIRLGTRGSMLAKMQSQLVADALEKAHTGVGVELVIIKTSGDAARQGPVGGKGLFVKELEEALLAGRVDLAVHSFKDLPVGQERAGLVTGAVPEREDARDVLVRAPGATWKGLADMPAGARVGTGSLRRRCQLLAQRSDVTMVTIGGNIDTRLEKLAQGQFDALILAMAGLRRTALFDGASMEPMDPREMVPAAGQGALAIQCRGDNEAMKTLLASVHDEATALCVCAERAVVARLGGDCHWPIGVLASLGRKGGKTMRIRCVVGGRDGKPPLITAQGQGEMGTWEGLVEKVHRELVEKGAVERLG